MPFQDISSQDRISKNNLKKNNHSVKRKNKKKKNKRKREIPLKYHLQKKNLVTTPIINLKALSNSRKVRNQIRRKKITKIIKDRMKKMRMNSRMKKTMKKRNL